MNCSKVKLSWNFEPFLVFWRQ